MPHTAQSLPRRLLTWTASLYALAMVVYLVLRLVFGDGFWWLSLLNSFAHLLFMPLVPLLALVALVRSRIAALRLLPLAVIGGLWFGPYLLPKSQAAQTGASLRVLTFNVWGNNHNLRPIEDWIRESQADVVLLQEVSPAYARNELTHLLDMYPYQSSQDDPTRWGGNMILSRYPILAQEQFDLQTPNSPIPLRVLVDVEGTPVALYNVHLAWPVSEPRLELPFNNLYMRVVLGFDDSARNQQITHLIEHLQNERYPYVVAGDFNTSASSATYQQLAAVMHDSFREAGSGLGTSWPVSGSRGLPALVPPLIRIDYIWHSDDFRAITARRGPRLTSDHLPVLATLELAQP
jgi:endonuclease/exonuclease/phosphatase family metal-dependent hydrolase